MRTAEWINVIFFSLLVGLAQVRRLDGHRRIKPTAIGAVGLGLVVLVQFAHQLLRPLSVQLIRDWLPGPLLLMAYWQSGSLFTKPNEKLQSQLHRLDETLADVARRYLGAGEIPSGVNAYLELAYLLCYPLVPLALGVLYLEHMGRYADEFWTCVLPPTYLCYAMVPFAQTLPPRSLVGRTELKSQPTKLRGLNLWILRHASIQVNTFPSGHVAASVAASAELLRHVPVAGAIALWIAASIACGAVAGRYHYTVDVLLAAVWALLWCWFARATPL